MDFKIIGFPFLLFISHLIVLMPGTIAVHHQKNSTKPKAAPGFQFKDFINKFTAATFQNKMLKSGRKSIKEATLTEIIEAFDPTDDLLNFDIDNIDTKNPQLLDFDLKTMKPISKSGRRLYFKPPGYILYDYDNTRDSWYLKPRLYALILQLMYLVREKMVQIHSIRAKFKHDDLYKMGFLFSKTDLQLKLLTSMNNKFYLGCANFRYWGGWTYNRMSHTDIADQLERLLNHWFELDLLTDMIIHNNDLCIHRLKRLKKQSDLRGWYKDEFYTHMKDLVITEDKKKPWYQFW